MSWDLTSSSPQKFEIGGLFSRLSLPSTLNRHARKRSFRKRSSHRWNLKTTDFLFNSSVRGEKFDNKAFRKRWPLHVPACCGQNTTFDTFSEQKRRFYSCTDFNFGKQYFTVTMDGTRTKQNLIQVNIFIMKFS